MKRMKLMILTALAVLLSCSSKAGELRMASSDTKVIVAYVTSWSSIMPDPQYMTHINYAFGHVSETFNGVGIDNENRLRGIVALKAQKPELKIMLSYDSRVAKIRDGDHNRIQCFHTQMFLNKKQNLPIPYM